MEDCSLVTFQENPIVRHDCYVEDVITVKLKNNVEILVTCGKDMEVMSYDFIKKTVSRYMGLEEYYSLLQVNNKFFIVGGMNGVFVIFNIEEFSRTSSLSNSVHRFSGRRSKFKSKMGIIRSLCKVNDRRFLAGDEHGNIYMFKFHPKDQPQSPTRRRISDSMEMIRDLPMSRFCRFGSHEERVVSLLKKGNFFFSAGGMSVDYRIRKWKLSETEENEIRRRTSSIKEAQKDGDLRGPEILFPNRHSNRIMDLSFLDDNETKIISCSNDDEMVIWDLEGVPLQKIVTKKRAMLCLLKINEKENKSFFLTGTTKGSLILTLFDNNPTTKELVLPSSTKYKEEKKSCHKNWVRKIVAVDVRGRKLFVSASDDGKLLSWRLKDSDEETEGEDQEGEEDEFGMYGSGISDSDEDIENLEGKIRKRKWELSEMKKRYEKAVKLKKTVDKKRKAFFEKYETLNQKIQLCNNIQIEELMGECSTEEDEGI